LHPQALEGSDAGRPKRRPAGRLLCLAPGGDACGAGRDGISHPPPRPCRPREPPRAKETRRCHRPGHRRVLECRPAARPRGPGGSGRPVPSPILARHGWRPRMPSHPEPKPTGVTGWRPLTRQAPLTMWEGSTLSLIWTAMLVISVAFALLQGEGGAQAITQGVIDGAENAVVFAFGLVGDRTSVVQGQA